MLRGQLSLFWPRPLPQDYGRDSNSNCEWDPVLKRRQARKLWQKIQNPRREPTQTFHGHGLDTLVQQQGRLKGVFSREFEANNRSKKGRLKSGTDFLPSDDAEKESLFSLSGFLVFRRRKPHGFSAQNTNNSAQKFDKAVKKCFRLNLANSLGTYLQRMCLICRSEICAELCLALSVFTITHTMGTERPAPKWPPRQSLLSLPECTSINSKRQTLPKQANNFIIFNLFTRLFLFSLNHICDFRHFYLSH